MAGSAFVILLLCVHAIAKNVRTRPRRRRSRCFGLGRLSMADATEFYDDSQLERAFRMPKESFNHPVNVLRPGLQQNSEMTDRGSPGAISPDVRVAITLRMLSGASYLCVMNTFKVRRSTVYGVFHSTVDVICEHLKMTGPRPG